MYGKQQYLWSIEEFFIISIILLNHSNLNSANWKSKGPAKDAFDSGSCNLLNYDGSYKVFTIILLQDCDPEGGDFRISFDTNLSYL